MKNEKNIIYFLMCLVVITWGLDYVKAKYALELLDPLSLLFFKYASAIFLVFFLKLKMDRSAMMRKKDLLLYVACAVFGDILYFHCEYTAMDYLPISLISIIIAWNGYNFVTEKLGKDYTTVSLTFNQLVCTLFLLAPYIVHRIPELPEFDYVLLLQLLYLGLICSGVGFLIMVRSLIVAV